MAHKNQCNYSGPLCENVLPVANLGSEGGKIYNLRMNSLQGNTLEQQNKT